MFNYSNNYIINSAKDAESGLAKWSAQAEDQGQGIEANLSIIRMGRFFKSAIKSVYRNVHTDGVAGKAVFTMAKGKFGEGGAGEGSYMLDLYVRLSGQTQDSRYANAFVLKGLPFTFSINVTEDDTTSTMATKFAEQINRMASEYGDFRLKAEAAGATLTVTAGEMDLVYNSLFERASLTQRDERKELPVDQVYREVNKAVVTAPVQPFGDYGWMVRNYILPTTENRAFFSIHAEDQPVQGGKYNQYVITICNRVGVQGVSHVGEVVDAETVHVFYVLDSGNMITSFEAALKTVVGEDGIIDAK